MLLVHTRTAYACNSPPCFEVSSWQKGKKQGWRDTQRAKWNKRYECVFSRVGALSMPQFESGDENHVHNKWSRLTPSHCSQISPWLITRGTWNVEQFRIFSFWPQFFPSLQTEFFGRPKCRFVWMCCTYTLAYCGIYLNVFLQSSGLLWNHWRDVVSILRYICTLRTYLVESSARIVMALKSCEYVV